MSRFVLDSSALLALLCNEEGAEVVAKHSRNACISWVNLAEVYAKQKDVNVSESEIDWALEGLQVVTVPFDAPQAKLVGSLQESTRNQGISFGDRACLALAMLRGLPVITAQKKWKELEFNVEIILLR